MKRITCPLSQASDAAVGTTVAALVIAVVLGFWFFLLLVAVGVGFVLILNSQKD